MKDAEERLSAQLQKERGYIYSRLRELDEKDLPFEETESEIKYLETTKSFLEGPTEVPLIETNEVAEGNTKARIGRPSRRSKTTKMRDAAVLILKERNTPIRGVALQRMIEEQIGFKIANMTTFMNTIIKTDDKILKLGRGLYSYQANIE